MASTVSDRCILLLEKSIDESKKQREQNSRILELLEEERERNKELMKQIEENNNKTPSGPGMSSCKRKRRHDQKLQVSSPCERKTKELYKELVKKEDFEGYNFEEMFSSATNQTVTRRIIQAVVDASGGPGTFPNLHIEEVMRTYFRSLRDGQRRKSKGVDMAHKHKCRKQIRHREKCERLDIALRGSGWDDAAFHKAKEIVTPDYISSEESSVEDDENGKDRTVFIVKKLKWESKKLRVIKKRLRKLYDDSLSRRQMAMIIPRIRNDQTFSARLAPIDAPQWTVSKDDEES